MFLRIVALAAFSMNVAGSSREPSRHFIQVNNVRLEYLDWGGKGEPLLFLAGLGDTPYIYNDLAPEFRAHFRCLGLTRRGYGNSEQPESGYELDNLVQDIAAFIDRLHLRNVNIVGHSFGGTEAIRLSELHPDLLHRAVLLDTAYGQGTTEARAARAKLFFETAGVPLEHVLDSMDTVRDFERGMHRGIWSPASEANLREQVIVNNDGAVKEKSPDRVEEAIFQDSATGKWDVTKVPVPALFVFAHDPLADRLPHVTPEIKNLSDEREAARRKQIEVFRRDSPRARIVEFEHTDHRCFIQRRDEVIREMNAFLH